jgi:hypothetical protein
MAARRVGRRVTPKPPLSDAAIRMAIASGAIVPPAGEGRPFCLNVEAIGWALAGWILAFLGMAMMFVAYLML